MGYITNVTGEFTITPPITWTEMKDTLYASDDWQASDLKLHVTEETVDTAEGQLIRKSANVLSLREIDEYRAYNLIADVQAAVDAFPGHGFTGYLHCEGEENDDIWRVVIRDGRAVEVKSRIVWDDEPDSDQIRNQAFTEAAAKLLEVAKLAPESHRSSGLAFGAGMVDAMRSNFLESR
jgi:hypothetical protein